MVRRILGVIVGIVLFGVGTSIVQLVGNALFPPAVPIDMRDPAAVAAMVDQVPLGAKLFVVLAYFIGALLGSWVGIRIAGWRAVAWWVLGAAWLGNVVNVMTIPHPLWMLIASFFTPLLGAWLAWRMSGRSD